MAIRLPKRKVATQDAAAGPTFAITCECGTTHEGPRRKRHQQIICNECATPLFVLPIDVYPTPASRTKKPEGDSVGATAGVLSASTSVVTGGVRRLGATANQTARQTAAKTTSIARWFFSPLKLAVFGVVLVGSLTAYMSHRRSAVAEAEQVARVATEDGFTFLREGRYEEAAAELTRAVDAIDYAGSVVPDERRIRQAARETSALANPATGSLVDLLDAVAEAGTDEDGYWLRAQQLGYADSWILMDAAVTRETNDTSTKTRIALPIRVGAVGKPVRVVADLDAFDEVPLSESPTTVTLAAKIKHVREFKNGWEVVLDPETGFLWETPSLYLAAGFEYDAFTNPQQGVETRLEQQRIWQGASPSEPAVDSEVDPDTEAATDRDGEEAEVTP